MESICVKCPFCYNGLIPEPKYKNLYPLGRRCFKCNGTGKKRIGALVWNPLETAPKDSRYILFTRTNPSTPNDIVIGFWHDGQNEPCFVASGSGLKIDTSRWIYWMPLPELAEPIKET